MSARGGTELCHLLVGLAVASCQPLDRVVFAVPSDSAKTLLLYQAEGETERLSAHDLSSEPRVADALAYTDGMELAVLLYEEELEALRLPVGPLELLEPGSGRQLPPSSDVWAFDGDSERFQPRGFDGHLAELRVELPCPQFEVETIWSSTSSITGVVAFAVDLEDRIVVLYHMDASPNGLSGVELDREFNVLREWTSPITIHGGAPDGEGGIIVAKSAELSRLLLDPVRVEPIASLPEETRSIRSWMAVRKTDSSLDGCLVTQRGTLVEIAAGGVRLADQIGPYDRGVSTGDVIYTEDGVCYAVLGDTSEITRLADGSSKRYDVPASAGFRGVADIPGIGVLAAADINGDVFRWERDKWELFASALGPSIVQMTPFEDGFLFFSAGQVFGVHLQGLKEACPVSPLTEINSSRIEVVPISESRWLVASTQEYRPKILEIRRVP